MKLIFKNIDKKCSGTVGLVAEEAEDMWHAYNLICVGDYLRASTIRRVVNEQAGLTSTSRVHTTLTICVKSLDFDTQASVLRVKGTNFEENQFVKMGAYHTIDLELNRKFQITKTEWDSVALERIEEACDPSQNADLAAVVMQEGLAHVCLILSSMTLVKSKIEMAIPRKRKGLCANHDKSLEKFFERIVQALQTHINFDIVKAVIIASPGFIKDQFYQFMIDYAVKNLTNFKVLMDNKSKFMLVHSASGFKHSLKEVFEDQNLIARLTDTKALGEVKLIEAFYQMLKTEPTRAYYGLKHVEKANEAQAIDTLLISDSLFRSKELSERKRYVRIVDQVREHSGQVKIFSSLHVSGEQLLQLTGIAAILRFPMPDLEDEELSDESDDENDKQTTEPRSRETFKPNGHICTSSEQDEAVSSTAAASATAPQSNVTKSNITVVQESNEPNVVASQAATTSSSAVNISTSTAKAKPKTKKFTNKENYYRDDDYDDYDYKNGSRNYDDYDDY